MLNQKCVGHPTALKRSTKKNTWEAWEASERKSTSGVQADLTGVIVLAEALNKAWVRRTMTSLTSGSQRLKIVSTERLWRIGEQTTITITRSQRTNGLTLSQLTNNKWKKLWGIRPIARLVSWIWIQKGGGHPVQHNSNTRPLECIAGRLRTSILTTKIG